MGKTKKKNDDDLAGKYTCHDCAVKRGGKWPKGHICTMSTGDCDFCKKEKTLASTSDYDWPHIDLSAGRD